MKATINYPPRVAYLADPMGCGLHSVVAVACEGLRAMGLESQARGLDDVARATSSPRLAAEASRIANHVLDVWTAYQAAGVRGWSKIAGDTYDLLNAIVLRTDPHSEVIERLVADTEPMLSADRDNREADCG